MEIGTASIVGLFIASPIQLRRKFQMDFIMCVVVVGSGGGDSLTASRSWVYRCRHELMMI